MRRDNMLFDASRLRLFEVVNNIKPSNYFKRFQTIFQNRLQSYKKFLTFHSQIVQIDSQIVQIFIFSLHNVEKLTNLSIKSEKSPVLDDFSFSERCALSRSVRRRHRRRLSTGRTRRSSCHRPCSSVRRTQLGLMRRW